MEETATTTPLRDVPLRMDAETFRRLGHALVDRIAEHFDTLPGRPLTSAPTPERIRERIRADAPLPDRGADADEILADATDALLRDSLFNGHPRFFGYITSSPAPIGVLGDLLAAAVNANVGAWKLSPVASEIEAQTVRWIADLLGCPDVRDGLLVSGGNMANMVGLWAASRRAAAVDIRAVGVAPAGPLRVYASAETHTWLMKGAALSGLGTDSIRWIPVDDAQRMRVDALRRQLAADLTVGEHPVCVVATAGSVSTGAVDPIADIADVCAEHGAWLHVDGAYGGFAAAVPSEAHRFRGLERADSIAVDPHKWLYAPLEAGCALVRDGNALRSVFAFHPPYYNFGDLTNFVDLGPQNSRGFRALKVWLGLRQAGREGAVRMIADDIALAEHLHRAVAAHPDFEALTRSLSIATFRYVPASLRDRLGEPAAEAALNTLNEALLDVLERSGEVFVSPAVVGGRTALRACVVNFNTTAADIDAVPDLIARHAAALDA